MPSPRALARPMLASMFVVGGADALRKPELLAPGAKPMTDRIGSLARRVAPGLPVPENAATWVRINGAAQIVGAAMLASGRLPRVAALGLAASLAPTTLAGHPFWRESDPRARATQRVHFFKNLSIAGGLLLAATDRSRTSKRASGKGAD